MSADDPPSYESVVAKLTERLGSHPKVEDIYKAGVQLSRNEKDVLIAHVYVAPPLNKEETEKFTLGAAQCMSSSEGKDDLRKEAHLANAAVLDIRRTFTHLTGELSDIDSRYTSPAEGPFAPRIGDLSLTFERVISTSRALATEIAAYAQQFDLIIIPMVEGNEPVEAKIRHLQVYIDAASRFQQRSDAILDDYTRLSTDFSIFTGTFGTWGEDLKGPENARLEALKRGLETLRSKLKAKKESLETVTANAAVVPIVVRAARRLRGVIGAAIAIHGLIAAAKSTAETTALIAAIAATNKDIDEQNLAIADVEKNLANIDVTQGQLQELGDSSIDPFNDSLEILRETWTLAVADCAEIQEWLRGGQDMAELPGAMRIYADEAVSIYESMAVYLRDYARAVQS